MTKISIITVTYNAGHTLPRTIESVFSQTYPDIEYVIIDGASRDTTVDIIRQHASRVSYWSSEPDQGLYDAMNKGLLQATGEYVWFLNAGDALPCPDTVARLMQQLTNSEPLPDIIYGETDLVDIHGNFIAHRRLKAPEHLSWKSFRKGMTVCHQSFIVKREIAPLYDLQYQFSSDYDWCIRCMKKSKILHNSHLVLNLYLHEGTTTTHRKASLIERFRIMVKYYGWIRTLASHVEFVTRLGWATLTRQHW
ncbi:MAG: glycosyltransferase [Bacteroidales bacterium]|jgi:glycosyltransferase involved in cell wall biosynthesis|nr:glycosyltransferase [Bacteroidales bacterium]